MPELSGKKIVAIYEGNCCLFAQTVHGEIYAWGNNDWGQLGIGEESEEGTFYKPRKMEFPGHDVAIIDIKCGALHNLALSINGQVFGWGDNQCRQITEDIVGNTPIHSTPICMTSDQLVIAFIYCYNNTSFMITKDNEVYYYGEDIWVTRDYDPKEEEELNKMEYIMPIQLPFQARNIICNDEFIFHLDQDETLFQFKNKCSAEVLRKQIPRRMGRNVSHSQDQPKNGEEQVKYKELATLLYKIREEFETRKDNFKKRQGLFLETHQGEHALDLSPCKPLWNKANQIIEEDADEEYQIPTLDKDILIKAEKDRYIQNYSDAITCNLFLGS